MPDTRKREFKGVWIPADVWTRDDLSAIDKVLLAEIDSFTGNGSSYHRSIASTAKFLGVSVATAKRSIAKLKQLELIRETGFDGRKRHLVSWQLAQNALAQNEPHTHTEESETDTGIPEPPKKAAKTDTQGFTALWQEYAGKTAILTGRDYGHVREILLGHSLEELRPLVAHYFEADFYFTRDGRDFNTFYVQIGKVADHLHPGRLRLEPKPWHKECPECGWVSPDHWSGTWCQRCPTPEDGRENLVKVTA